MNKFLSDIRGLLLFIKLFTTVHKFDFIFFFIINKHNIESIYRLTLTLIAYSYTYCLLLHLLLTLALIAYSYPLRFLYVSFPVCHPRQLTSHRSSSKLARIYGARVSTRAPTAMIITLISSLSSRWPTTNLNNHLKKRRIYHSILINARLGPNNTAMLYNVLGLSLATVVYVRHTRTC